MKRRNQWLAAPLGAATAAALLSGCGSTDGANAGSGKGVVMGISDKVKSTDPAAGYDPGSWLLFNNVFQSLLSFPKGGTTPSPTPRSPAASRAPTASSSSASCAPA